MDESVKRGWLLKIDDGQYKVSEKGFNTVQRFLEIGNKLFGDLPSLQKVESNRTAELLSKVVKNAHKLPEPVSKPSMEIGIRLDPGDAAPSMLRIRRHLTDLYYYREDVHIAAWQPFYNVDGRVFETLTYIWRDGPSTPTEMAEQLSEYRNYEEADYMAAFEELVSYGWAAKDDGKFIITKAGKNIRQEAEDRTDRYFARPFAILNKAETEELKGLLEKLAEVVKSPENEGNFSE